MLNRLRELREKKHMTQAQLARAVQVSRQVISAIESNQQSPSLKLALLLCNELDAKVDEVFFEDGDNFDGEKQTEVMTKQQRLELVNQYRILKGISTLLKDEHDAQRYEYFEEVFERGYTYLYHEPLEHMYEEMPTANSEVVLSILDMHRALLWSLGPEPTAEEIKKVRFLGFDGNNEASELSFAEFYQNDPSMPRFAELKVVNSHHPTLQRYSKMLAEWERLKRKPQLTREQIDQILNAGTFR